MTPKPLNLANAVTVFRLVLTPVFVALVIESGMVSVGWRIAACTVFCLAGFSDFLDGWLARSRGEVTTFGKIADPIADKALTGSALVLLSAYDRLWWWVTALVLVREVGVTLLRWWVARYQVIAASRGGKLKTALQLAAIAWYLWPFTGAIAAVGPWLMTAAVLATVVTGADYLARVHAIRRTAMS